MARQNRGRNQQTAKTTSPVKIAEKTLPKNT